ncbi:Bestrophin, RFP-TM, chloride channel-domain-containing protein [Cyathus striatus]|nr:Bestrophin, RFP-TM, chloride channel-domain-containing protein [Cyathus striatus]
MVSQNPLFQGGWSIKKVGAMVLNDIWPGVLFFTLIATGVVVISEKTDASLALPSQLLTVLGTILGLVISFRTSSAYERYQDGRKMWTNITSASRNLGQMFWIHVPHVRSGGNAEDERTRMILKSVIEKKTMIKLIQAFAVSVKHLLRNEEGVGYADLYPLIKCLPRFANTLPSVPTDADVLPLWYSHKLEKSKPKESDHSSGDEYHSEEPPVRSKSIFSRGHKSYDSEKAHLAPVNVDDTIPELKPARNPPRWQETIFDHVPILRFFRFCYRIVLRRPRPKDPRKMFRMQGRGQLLGTHVPLEIWLVLSNYSGWLMHQGLVQNAIATGLTNNLTLLQDTLCNLERICNTPLPFAYQAHLRISLWLYLFFLPSQIYSSFGYLTIPATTLVAFFLIGFLEIGQEIENPFNYDLNDLDMDHFCYAIERDLHEITAHTNPDPADFLFNGWNEPFAPADKRSAEVMVTGPNPCIYKTAFDTGDNSEDNIRRTLLRGWREVDRKTRKI